MCSAKMTRLLQFAAILALTVSLCSSRAIGEDKLKSVTNKQKGLKMLSHRPWFGKRGGFPLHNKVGKNKIPVN